MKNKKIIRYQIIFIFLVILIGFAVLLNVNTGSVKISLINTFKIIFFNQDLGSVESNIIWTIRLPRMLAAGILGGSLAVSGFLLQTFFRNPIAGPFVLGISSGAKMFVSIVVIVILKNATSISSSIIVTASIIGSLISMSIVLLFAGKVKNMSMLLVIGIIIAYICSAITDFFITFAEEADIVNLTHWSMGSFSGINWQDLKLFSIIIIVTLCITFLFSKPIAAYQLGENYAKSMGVNIKFFRIILILLSSILSATVTAFAGPISFVGIAVPHITKLLFKTTKPMIIIPGSFLCGAVFCLFCDLIARTILAPVEISISTVTAAFGAPIVIALMLSRNKKVS